VSPFLPIKEPNCILLGFVIVIRTCEMGFVPFHRAIFAIAALKIKASPCLDLLGFADDFVPIYFRVNFENIPSSKLYSTVTFWINPRSSNRFHIISTSLMIQNSIKDNLNPIRSRNLHKLNKLFFIAPFSTPRSFLMEFT
jgi:hypothetical protein